MSAAQGAMEGWRGCKEEMGFTEAKEASLERKLGWLLGQDRGRWGARVSVGFTLQAEQRSAGFELEEPRSCRVLFAGEIRVGEGPCWGPQTNRLVAVRQW